MSLSVDNLIGVQPTLTSSTNLQCQQIDIYNGTTNFHRITSSSASPLMTINIPNASGTIILNTATQTITNKMNHAQVGSATDPSYSFIGNLNLGFFRSAANAIGITTAGVERITISDVSATSTIPINCDNFRAINLGGAGNTVFGNSASTSGMYFDVNRINFSTNSALRVYITDTLLTTNNPLVIPTGSSTNCSIQFSGAATTGIHNNGAFYITQGGTNMMRFQSAQNFSERIHNFTTGTAAAPSVVGTSYQTTGLYWTATPTLGVAVSGAQTAGFESGGMRLYGSTAGNNALYSASLLGYYEDYTYITKFGFSATYQTTDITCRVIRVGNKVTIIVPYWAQTINNGTGGGANCTALTALPVRFTCGSGTTVAYACGIVGGANTNCIMYLLGSGTTIYCMPTVGLWANGTQLNWFGASLTYFL